MRRLIALVLALVLAGCPAPPSRLVEGRYPAAPGEPTAAPGEETATLDIQFTGDVSNAHLAVNGRPVATGARTQRIIVHGIPAGDVAVMLAAEGGVEKAFGLHLEPGQHMVVPVSTPAPPARTVHPLVQALLTLFVYITYAGVTSLF
jgi:hypothetical protein